MSRSMSSSERALELEEEALHLGSAAIVSDVPPGPDNAVARDDDRNRVGAAGRPRRANGASVAGEGRDLRVGERLAEADLAELIQHPAVERAVREPHVDLQVERSPAAREVLVE